MTSGGETAVSRAELIEDILSRRVRRAEDLTVWQDFADRLALAAENLESARDELCQAVDGDARTILEGLGGSLSELRRRVDATRRELGRAEARFRRTVLTIGTIGRSGQGKSTMLQSLTGLTNREIPAAGGTFVTGVPSYIRHVPGETSAEIEFHDARSFREEVLGRYYPALGLGAVPTSLDEFASQRLPQLAAREQDPAQPVSAADSAAYGHLVRYKDHLKAYRARLESRTRVESVPAREIWRYVAQSDENRKEIHDFRAVRAVRISTPFGREDLGRIALVDLPGLGDTNLGDVELLRRALGGEVDVAVFLKRPDPIRFGVEDTDVKLYDIAQAALPELPLERWCFLLLNRVSGEAGNSDAVDGQRQAVLASRLRFADLVEADCTAPDQVEKAFDTIFGHLVTAIDELDQTLVGNRLDDIAAVCQEADGLARQAAEVARFAAAEDRWRPRFLELYAPVYKSFAGAVEDLVAEYRKTITTADPELSGAVREVLRQLREERDTLVPTVEQIEDQYGEKGSYLAVFSDCVNELRSAISRRFLELDGALKNRVGAMHRDLADALRGPGRLVGVSGLEGRDFLAHLEQSLPRESGLTDELAYGLCFVRDYTLNYRGLLQHRVRRALARLEPDQVAVAAGIRPEEIRYMLEEYLRKAVYDIEGQLEKVLVEPHEAVFAVVEEFRDRALRVAEARDAWQVVYEMVRTAVWPDEFEALAANTALFQRWRAALDGLAGAMAAGPAVPGPNVSGD
jgi:hypothetical protein